MDDEVYMFIFGSKEHQDEYFLIDFTNLGDISFINISTNTDKLLPFARDLVNKEGFFRISSIENKDEFVLLNDENTMSMEELRNYLELKRFPCSLKWIEVE